jgi:hypothetical protein
VSQLVVSIGGQHDRVFQMVISIGQRARVSQLVVSIGGQHDRVFQMVVSIRGQHDRVFQLVISKGGTACQGVPAGCQHMGTA